MKIGKIIGEGVLESRLHVLSEIWYKILDHPSDKTLNSFLNLLTTNRINYDICEVRGDVDSVAKTSRESPYLTRVPSVECSLLQPDSCSVGRWLRVHGECWGPCLYDKFYSSIQLVWTVSHHIVPEWNTHTHK